MAHALKPPNSRELSAKPFSRKGSWLVVADFLVSVPLFFFFFFFFRMWMISKVLNELVIILLLFHVLVLCP